MPYKMLNAVISICAHTLPFAAKISDVTPTNAAISVNKSKLLVNKLDTSTIDSEHIQSIHSFFLMLLLGYSFLISFKS